MPRIADNYGRALQELTADMKEKDAKEAIERLVEMLSSRHELHLAPKILEAYADAADKADGVAKVRVASAEEIAPAARKKIAEHLEHALKRPIVARWDTDPSLIGGAVIRYDDVLLDASVKGSLERLKQQLI